MSTGMDRTTPPRPTTVQGVQGVVITGVRQVHGAGGSRDEIVPGTAMHLLVWPDRGYLRVRLGSGELGVRSPFGLWLPAGQGATMTSDASLWIATFAADTCPAGWRRVLCFDL